MWCKLSSQSTVCEVRIQHPALPSKSIGISNRISQFQRNSRTERSFFVSKDVSAKCASVLDSPQFPHRLQFAKMKFLKKARGAISQHERRGNISIGGPRISKSFLQKNRDCSETQATFRNIPCPWIRYISRLSERETESTSRIFSRALQEQKELSPVNEETFIFIPCLKHISVARGVQDVRVEEFHPRERCVSVVYLSCGTSKRM